MSIHTAPAAAAYGVETAAAPRARADELRRRRHILVDGDDVPPPARCFGDLRLPEPILRTLRDKGIEQPKANTSAGATCRALRAGHDRYRVHGVRLREPGYPEIRPMLCTGGVDRKTLMEVVKKGVHIVVATPGRLKGLLAKKKMNLDNWYLTLDEADRLVDLGFEDDIREVFAHFKAQRQTLLFSATVLEKIQNFAKSALVKPVIVKCGKGRSSKP